MAACIEIKEISTVYKSRQWSKRPLNTPEAVNDSFHWLKHETKEKFIAVHLTSKNCPIAFETVAIGGLAAAVVHPRDVFKAAILSNAASVILIHNHPSGDVMPSSEDVRLTKIMRDGGKILGIEVLDHIIIGDGFSSLKEKGLML